MITATEDDQGRLRIEARLSGIAAYLDHFAIIKLARGAPDRRNRFIESLRREGSLLFSGANAVELAGPQGETKTAVDALLDAIGPCWIPIELAPWVVSEREQAGVDPMMACVEKDFLPAFYRDRRAHAPSLDATSDEFWNLRWAVDWTGTQRQHFMDQLPQLDAELARTVADGRRLLDEHPEKAADPPPFDPRKRATYVLVHLVRKLVEETRSHAIKKGDAMDFCHSVMGAAFGSFALLDKHWKRRLTEGIPDRRRIARLYYEPELDQLVDEFQKATTRTP